MIFGGMGYNGKEETEMAYFIVIYSLQIVVFWVVIPCINVVPSPNHFTLKMLLRNAGIRPHHYTESLPRRP
jgi:hypothetical protein